MYVDPSKLIHNGSIMTIHVVFLVLVIVVGSSAATKLPLSCSSEDAAVLGAFRRSVGAAFLPDWPANGDSCNCSWDGVVCNPSSGRITGLYISIGRSFYPLAQHQPIDNVSLPRLCALSELQALSLQFDIGRRFKVPSCFFCSLANLVDLTFIDLSYSIQGELPTTCDLNSAPTKQLSLRKVELEGHFTTEDISSVCIFQNLTSLTVDSLFTNGAYTDRLFADSLFVDGLPSCLSELHHLTSLSISSSFTTAGSVLCKLQNLTLLELGVYHQHIPACVWSLQKLSSLSLALHLQQPGIQEEIPPSLCSLANLTYLHLEGDFTSFPSCFCNLRSLTTISLFSMSAIVPACTCSLPHLQVLTSDSASIDAGCFSSPTLNLVLSSLDLSVTIVPSSPPPPINLSFSSFVNLIHLSLDNPAEDQRLAVSLNSLCPLTKLQSLSLRNFATADGSIPACIGNLSNLQVLELSHAFLAPAPLPSFLSNLTSLTYLDLSHNQFQVSSPTRWQNLSALNLLILSNNPQVLPNEPLPQWLFKLPHLFDIDFSACNLGPESLKCSTLLQINRSLGYLDLSNNNLSADILHCFANYSFASILDLTLSANPFDTNLPYRFSSQLQSLSLSGCKLRGNLPPGFIESQLNLQSLDLSHNNLVGDIPLGTAKNSSSSSQLRSLDLSNNNFRGVAGVGDLPFLATFIASKNRLTGNFSLLLERLGGTSREALCAGDNAWINLDFSGNNLIGFLPPALGQCSSLRRLYLGNNSQIQGEIPLEFGNLTQLRTLSLHNNQLRGEIPQTLSSCTSLVVLDLSHNALSGNLEQSGVRNMTNLRVLVLASNGFSGSIPAWIGSFSAFLQVIDLSNNNFWGTVPQHLQLLAFLNSTSNSLLQTGILYEDSIQLTIKGHEDRYTSNLAIMIALDLSGNHLTGVIPPGLGELHSMVSLNLSRNKFTGPIPPALSKLTNLESLDLSYNSLEGSIPDELTNLFALAVFNVSYNLNLSGKIPLEKQFLAFSNDCYIGDIKLCGAPILKQCDLVPQEAINPPKATESQSCSSFRRFVEDWIWIPAIYVFAPIMFLLTVLAIRIWKPSLMFPDDL